MKNETLYMAAGKLCVLAHEDEYLNNGPKEAMTVHLQRFRFATGGLMVNRIRRRGDETSSNKICSNHGLPATTTVTSNNKRQRMMETYLILAFGDSKVNNLHDLLIEFTAENNLSFQWIERQSSKRLIDFLNPVAVDEIPTRMALSTKVLDRGCGDRVNLVSDVWENSILWVSFSHFVELTGHTERLNAVPDKIDLLSLNAWRRDVGAIVTSNAGQCLRWPQIAFLFCFAHQINLLVKDVRTRIFGTIPAQATAINTFPSLHSKVSTIT
ncbi:hypothetical protein PsorP6_017883 [Peronosclerospora sorghi]|uniref:Uncharacterized protein n=1 Tax=Peronosclerospora sorghi TaxID=230839 RepID=A0ACC0WFF7_9STRA|nr:hypothetical protein PsorP6_017883 [Peronosclerospora sorghi]